MKYKKIIITLCVFGLLTGLAFSNVDLGPNNAYALQEERSRIIQVNGEAEISAQPDLVKITIAVETEENNAQEAVEKNSRLSNSVINALKRSGIKEDNIETRSFRVNSFKTPINDRSNDYKTNYRAFNEIIVSSEDISKAGSIIDVAIKAGANRIQSVTFDIKNPIDLKLQALQKATKQASQKADAIATAAGVNITELKSIKEDRASYTPFRGEYMEESAMMDSAQTPIHPGEVTVRASVTAEYSF